MQQVFYQLIETEIRSVMLANVQGKYICKTGDSGVAPLEKSGPKLALIAILATVIGGMLGIFPYSLGLFERRQA